LLGQAVVENALARVYNKQACVYFDVAAPTNCSTNYDINTNQLLDVDWEGYNPSAEEYAVGGNACCPDNLYRKAIFVFGVYELAPNPAQPHIEVLGIGRPVQRWADIGTVNLGTGTIRDEVIAHEVAHTLDLPDVSASNERLMATNAAPQGAGCRLLRDEWRIANTTAELIRKQQ
jgi:hypothetical protein